MHILQNKSNSVHTVAFSQDSRRLAVVSSDGVTTFRRVSTGKVIATIGQSIRTGFSLSCAAVSPDFRYVVTVEHDLNQWGIRIWNTETGSTEHFLGWYELPDTEESKTAKGPPYSPPRALTFLTNSRALVGGNEYGIFICDVLGGTIQNRSSSTSRASQKAPWDEESREEDTKLPPWYEYTYHWVDGLQVSPDSETVAYLTKRGKAYLYDLKNSDEPRIFESWTAPGRVAISPDWRLLVTTSWNNIVIWEISTNHIVKVLHNNFSVGSWVSSGDQPIQAVMFSPDSKHVFVLSGFHVKASVSGQFYLQMILCEFLYRSIGQAIAAYLPNDYFAALTNPIFIGAGLISFCGVVVPYSQIQAFWRYWIYYLDPFTYLIGGLLEPIAWDVQVECKPAELADIPLPTGNSTTCGSYMKEFIASNGGYVADPESSSQCYHCAYATGAEYVKKFNIDQKYYGWRDVGITALFCLSSYAFVLLMMKLRSKATQKAE
ncbi:unnamed protein product [Fusarium equiseti]|uniref:ABC-2 type transporter transmembrane domain-containing protein n=1 Tax=Fusarium equiseti TaxID=61235 RepID=A0A8J2IUW0_FUSEQ|nr:unnamed protein product [Fusarium equiseti]